MTSEGLGEMFEGDSADTCARKFPLMLMGGRAHGPACADGEWGPPLAWAEILSYFLKPFNFTFTLNLFHENDTFYQFNKIRFEIQKVPIIDTNQRKICQLVPDNEILVQWWDYNDKNPPFPITKTKLSQLVCFCNLLHFPDDISALGTKINLPILNLTVFF